MSQESVMTKVPLFRRVVFWILFLPIRLLKTILLLIVDVEGRLHPGGNIRPQSSYHKESTQDRTSRLSR